MDKRVVDLSGQTFGDWLVLSYAQRRKTDTLFWCRCVCGNIKLVIANTLKKGSSKSCGCKSRERASQKMIKHGMASTPTYKSWHAMIQRTQGKGGHQSYVDRGIDVCDEWLSFDGFFADMGVRPKGCSLDRIDNSKGYCLQNCRWADGLTQANNKDTNRREIVDGELMTVTQAARKYGVGISCVRHRLRKGWTLQDAVRVPPR
jgi:transcription elongation factor Elf1